jgi:hypothetical protein
MYRDRVGAFYAMTRETGQLATVLSHGYSLARAAWSMPPDHGAAAVRLVLEDEALVRDWLDELETMRRRIRGVRERLAAAGRIGTVDLAPIATQNGLFAMLKLSGEQIAALRAKHGRLHGRFGADQRRGADRRQPRPLRRGAQGCCRLMDRQPTLEGERLLLRPMAPGDWEALYAVAADPLVWEIHPAHDRWQEPVFRAFFEDALAKGGALVVIDKHVLSEVEGQEQRIVGSSRFQNYDPKGGGSVEIGLDVPRPQPLGRQLQQRDEAADDRSRTEERRAGLLRRR